LDVPESEDQKSKYADIREHDEALAKTVVERWKEYTVRKKNEKLKKMDDIISIQSSTVLSFPSFNNRSSFRMR
jgi:hypothetical protein